ncbi:MAG: tRNA lysidine(34) synthetase TilS [Roseimicrobium sp.]
MAASPSLSRSGGISGVSRLGEEKKKGQGVREKGQGTESSSPKRNLTGTDLLPFAQKAAAALSELQSRLPSLSSQGKALVAVSGGRDSVALLHFLASNGWKRLIVCHLDHQLRGKESDADAAFVKKLAKKFELTCEFHREDVAASAKSSKQSLETAARAARDSLFHTLAKTHRTPYVFLAHHAEDNAETILGNLCRGSGLHGLSGMPISATTREGLVKLRPLLDVRRAEIDAYLEAHDLTWREDSSNTSRAHRRNRLRHDVLPMLADANGRDVVELILRTARLAGRDEACLQESARLLAEGESLHQPGGSLLVTPAFKASHPAIQSRVLKHWLVEIQKISSVGVHEIEGALAMLQAGGPAKVNLSGSRYLRRKAKRLWVE